MQIRPITYDLNRLIGISKNRFFSSYKPTGIKIQENIKQKPYLGLKTSNILEAPKNVVENISNFFG